jgi:PAS domain S-box-containing protein
VGWSVRVRVNPVIVAGEVRSVILIARDVTDQQRAELALRDSELRYRLLAENATDVIARHGPSGQWLYVSPACRLVLGYEPTELIGQNSFDYIHPDDRAHVAGLLAEMRISGRPQASTFRVRRGDGRYAWLDVAGRAVHDPATQQLTEIITTARDVTERIETSEKLHAREAELAHLDRLSTMAMASELAHELKTSRYMRRYPCLSDLPDQPEPADRGESQRCLADSAAARRPARCCGEFPHFTARATCTGSRST